jgi:hypothetical protein
MKTIRLWKIGSMEHNILPNKAMIEKVTKLVKNINESTDQIEDIVWGPELSLSIYHVNGDADDYIVENGKLVKIETV